MNKREIIGRLKRRYPEATKIFQDEFEGNKYGREIK